MRLNIQNKGWYWQGMEKDISSFVQTCPECVQINNVKYLRPSIKQIISNNHERYITGLWELPAEISSDSLYKYILDIIDHFSKFLTSYPLLTKSSKEVLNHIKNFIETNGKPCIVQTDNGKEFVNSLSESYYQEEGIKHFTSSPYHPESNGYIEVTHKETRKAILSEFLRN